MSYLLTISIAIIFAIFFTKLLEQFKLPNVTAYIIAGIVVGPYVLKIINDTNLSSLSLFSLFGLGFIAFSIGIEFKLSHIKQLGAKVLIITVFQALTATFLVDLVLILLGFPNAEAITLGAIATATAPAATILVVRQYKSKGELTDILLPVVAMDDALWLIVFAVSISIAQLFDENAAFSFTSTVITPVVEIILSILLGSVLGFILNVLCRVLKNNSNRLCLTIAFVLLGIYISKQYQLSDLLVCVSISSFL